MLSLTLSNMKGTDMEQRRYYPTHFEILAIERAARRAQAEELRRLLMLAARRLRVLAVRGATALSQTLVQSPALVSPRGSDERQKRAVRKLIIEGLALSLPAHVRERYAADLAAAARIEPLIDAGLAAWDLTVRVLAQVFHGMARGLRAVARSLDLAAGRLTPTH
jgi:hypothetical protein